jgi:hypothetical protein
MQSVSTQRIGKHVAAETNTHTTIELLLEMVFSVRSVQSVYKEGNWATPRGEVYTTYSTSKEINKWTYCTCLAQSRLMNPPEAGSNTSTVTLRVVGGDEKGSLKSATVKYGREPQGTRTLESLRWQGPAACTKDRLVLLSERAPPKNKTQMGLDTRTYWLTHRQSQCEQ